MYKIGRIEIKYNHSYYKIHKKNNGQCSHTELNDDVATKLAGMVVAKKAYSCLFLVFKIRNYETENFYSSSSNRTIYCL